MALAGQPLLQQSSHLWRLHHHQSMGHHCCPLCTQVRLLAWPALKVWCYRLHRGELSVINSCTTLDTLTVLSSPLPSSFFIQNVSYRQPQVSSWVVYAGIVTRSSAKMAQHTGYAVEKIIYNKDYNHRSHDNDIALMKLQTPLNFSGQSGIEEQERNKSRCLLFSYADALSKSGGCFFL